MSRTARWQAEYWISAARDYALSLACQHRGLPVHYGRGFDELPADVLDSFDGAIVRALDRDELLRALSCTTERLLAESTAVSDVALKLESELHELVQPTW